MRGSLHNNVIGLVAVFATIAMTMEFTGNVANAETASGVSKSISRTTSNTKVSESPETDVTKTAERSSAESEPSASNIYNEWGTASSGINLNIKLEKNNDKNEEGTLTLHIKPVDDKQIARITTQLKNSTVHVNNSKFELSTVASKITKVVFDKQITMSVSENMFKDMKNLESVENINNIKFKEDKSKDKNQADIVTTAYMFEDCTKLKHIGGIENWDLTNVVNADGMFDGCSSITTLDLESWKVPNLELAQGMFMNMKALTTLTLFKQKEASLTRINNMFTGDQKLNELNNIADLKTSKVVEFYQTFAKTSLTTLDLSKWDTSAAGTDKTETLGGMYAMFALMPNLKSIKFGEKWNTSNVTNMSSMFYNDSNLKSIDVSNWNTKKVTDMHYMFEGSGIQSLNISGWTVPQGTVDIPDGNGKTYKVSTSSNMLYTNNLRDVTFPRVNIYSSIPVGIWRDSSGISGVNPGENIDLITNTKSSKKSNEPVKRPVTSTKTNIRKVRDYIKVTFKTSGKNSKTVNCVADVLQGKDSATKKANTYSINGIQNFISCKQEDANKASRSASDSSTMTLAQVKNALGIKSGDTVKWDIDETPVVKSIKEIVISGKGAESVHAGIFHPAKGKDAIEVTANNKKEQSDSAFGAYNLLPWKDVTFTAHVTHNSSNPGGGSNPSGSNPIKDTNPNKDVNPDSDSDGSNPDGSDPIKDMDLGKDVNPDSYSDESLSDAKHNHQNISIDSTILHNGGNSAKTKDIRNNTYEKNIKKSNNDGEKNIAGQGHKSVPMLARTGSVIAELSMYAYVVMCVGIAAVSWKWNRFATSRGSHLRK